MIIAGPGVPVGTCETPVSLIDVQPTVLDNFGLAADRAPLEKDLRRPGRSLLDIGSSPVAAERPVFSEYHAAGSPTGFYMVRNGGWKYVHYVGAPPELYDLESDPHERHDLGNDAGYRGVLADCEERLRSVVDPEEASARAFRDQAAMVEAHGGAEAIRRRGEFSHTPAPGDAPDYAER